MSTLDLDTIGWTLRQRGIDAATRNRIMDRLRAAAAQEQIEIDAGRPAESERDLMLAASRSNRLASLAKLAAATARRLGVTIPNAGINGDLLDSQLAGKDIRSRIELKKMLSDLNLIR
jgi:hypothetical protein